MAYKQIAVPPAGKSESFDMSGRSVIVINAPAYFSPEQAPKISFDNPGAGLPGLTGSRYPNSSGYFSKIVVTGTAESAGDELALLSVAECVDFFVEVNPNRKAIAGNTQTKQMDDTVKELTALEIMDAEGNLPQSIYISAEGADILYRWNDGSGSDPAPDGSQSHRLADGAEPIEIQGIDFIENKLKFVNAVTAETPYFIWTPRY